MTTRNSICLHTGRCGGCKRQDVAYDQQLELKETALKECFARHWSDSIPVAASPNVFFYRNKIELHFDRLQYDEKPTATVDRPTVLGFRERGKWYSTIDLEECRIFSPWLKALFPHVRQWYRREGLKYFHNRSQEGFLKHLVLRESKNENQRLVMVITAPGEFNRNAFVDAILKAGPCDSIYRGVQLKTGDVAFADELELLYGEPVIYETLSIPTESSPRDLRFEIGPLSFFQINPPVTEELYGAVREAVAAHEPEFVYDFYGGAGGIAFSISDLCDEILSVESFEAATEAGRRNATMNGIDNVRFETASVEKWLARCKAEKSFRSDAVTVVDPPRSAMHPKALRRLLELRPRSIVYVSCNPKLLARELDDFSEYYDLTSLRGFDLFPHTDHVEVLATLELKKNDVHDKQARRGNSKADD